ncbi:MAG: copper resistance protein CopC [Actinobacteria bacterium]|nr:copper resistance protein CopC [Actinomycetota bacterium]MCB8996804.1 copper resistance protein CopC [Actinomycetota bacterium]MCB9414362.1 copper resistance protein CopC [Actinomycetota bacterium]
MPARLRRVWALLAVALFATALASPAAAHTDLVSSDPANGATLDTAPERITLKFGEAVLPSGAQIVAKSANGTKVDLGPAEVSGAKVTATWPADAADGAYRVSWRVAGEDGHPLEGAFGFTVKAAAPSASAAPEPITSASPVADTTEEAGSGVNLLLPALLVVALVGLGLFVWRSRAN